MAAQDTGGICVVSALRVVVWQKQWQAKFRAGCDQYDQYDRLHRPNRPPEPIKCLRRTDMPLFIKMPTFDIYDEATGKWADPDEWWLDGPLVYQSDLIGEDGKPVLVEVPDKYETDLASIPRIFRLLFIKNGRHRPAAVPHDFLCRLGLEFPRPLGDKIFLEAMKFVGVKRRKRYPMYWAVRANTERLILMGKARKMKKQRA